MLDYILGAGIIWGAVKLVNKLNEILGYGPGGRRPGRYVPWETPCDGSRRPSWESHIHVDDSMDLHRGRNHALRNICDLGDGLD